MSDEIPVFECDLQEKPIILRIKGVDVSHVLVEMDGNNRDEFVTDFQNRIRRPPGCETDRIVNHKNLESGLIKRCLFRVEPDGSRSPLTDAEINALGYKLREKLFDECQKLSGLNPEADADAKND